MTHITLSIPDKVYEEMKQHPEINWSAVARGSIIEKTTSLKKKTTSKELLNQLPKEIQDSILKTNKKESKDYYKKVRKEGLKRTKFLIRA